MSQRKKAIFNWSGGKDSALALYKILKGNEYEVVSLLTAINEETQKSSIHSVPLNILLKQAKSIGVPLYTIAFSKDLKNYDQKMAEAVNHFKVQGVTRFIFGDIFLSDIKKYRESKLNPLGIEVVEPLWNKSSKEVIDEFLASGIKTKIIVTQADKLDQSFVGRELDEALVALLPEDVDVCGENGEYHTLSYAGGPFKEEINFSMGETHKISYDITLDTGEIRTYEYWQAEIN